MSLGVHLMTAWLVAQMTFDGAVSVLGKLSGYAPSKRSSLGVIAHVERVDSMPVVPRSASDLAGLTASPPPRPPPSGTG